ncbi:hypothetical protein ACMHYB_03150 [Sorangium sp. So ce1128]
MENLRITRARDRLIRGPVAALVDPSTLVGTWLNYDSTSRGIFRVILAGERGAVSVRILGSGEPEPVDWGEAPAEVFASDVSSEEAVGFKAFYALESFRTMLASYLNKRLLVVDAYTTFHDGSGRSSYFCRDHFYLR